MYILVVNYRRKCKFVGHLSPWPTRIFGAMSSADMARVRDYILSEAEDLISCSTVPLSTVQLTSLFADCSIHGIIEHQFFRSNQLTSSPKLPHFSEETCKCKFALLRRKAHLPLHRFGHDAQVKLYKPSNPLLFPTHKRACLGRQSTDKHQVYLSPSSWTY
jgi:hypothetical protein